MKRIFLSIIVVIMMLSLCACRSIPQNSEDVGAIDSETRSPGIEGSWQVDEKNSAQITEKINEPTKDNNFEKENSNASNLETIITDETEKYIALEKDGEPITTDEDPTTKVFELNKEKIVLTFKDKSYANNTWYQYNYTDEAGIEYMFYEDEGFVGIANLNRDYDNSIVISEDEALEIAKKCASELFPNEFDKYTLLESNFNSSLKTYTFLYYKNYGIDDCLKGEVCNIQVYSYGDIKRCHMRNLYVFKDFDESLVENISQDDIDKLALQLISKKYNDAADWAVTESSASLQYRGGNWVISLTIEAKNSKTENTISEFGYFEIN